MSDKHLEKIFVYLLAISALLHVAVAAVIIMFPQERKTLKQDPYMVELRDLPETKPPVAERRVPRERQAENQQRLAREMAPRREKEQKSVPPPPISRPEPAQPLVRGRDIGDSQQAERNAAPLKEASPGEKLFKPHRQNQPELAKLFPRAARMADLEEGYRKKYGPEVGDGETAFLNTDDILFGSFLRRFETAVYGVWRYPQEAARQGIQGVTPVKITFNRKGEIEHVQLLESSGSRILDEEVLRALREIGRVGSLPRGYTKDTFKLIAFFQYGITRGGISGTLH